jgi:hypothetical protein
MDDDQVAQTPPAYSKLSEEQRERVDAYLATNPFGEQNEYGIDRSLLRRNLRLTPTQRYANHQRALRLLHEVKRAGTELGLR